FKRAEQVVGVGNAERRLLVRLGQFEELAKLQRPLQQRIGRMDVQMNKAGTGHGVSFAATFMWHRWAGAPTARTSPIHRIMRVATARPSRSGSPRRTCPMPRTPSGLLRR